MKAHTRPPVVWIAIELEGPVRIVHSAQSEDEQVRLLDWLVASPGRWELMELAVGLVREARVAR